VGFLRVGSSREDEAREFIEAPFEAVDCALLILSESVRQVIHDRVERSYQVRREDIS